MPSINLNLKNKATYTDQQGKITKPVKYDKQTGQLQVKGPLAKLLARMKAVVTPGGYQAQIRGSVDKALAAYAKDKFGATAKQSYLQSASKSVETKAQLKDAVRGIRSAAGFPAQARSGQTTAESVTYAKVDPKYLAERRAAKEAAKEAARETAPSAGAVSGSEYDDENPYEFEDLSQSSPEPTYDAPKPTGDDQATIIAENELYSTSGETKSDAAAGGSELYSEAATVDKKQYEDIADTERKTGASKEQIHEDSDTLSVDDENPYEDVDLPTSGSDEEPIYEEVGNIKPRSSSEKPTPPPIRPKPTLPSKK